MTVGTSEPFEPNITPTPLSTYVTAGAIALVVVAGLIFVPKFSGRNVAVPMPTAAIITPAPAAPPIVHDAVPAVVAPVATTAPAAAPAEPTADPAVIQTGGSLVSCPECASPDLAVGGGGDQVPVSGGGVSQVVVPVPTVAVITDLAPLPTQGPTDPMTCNNKGIGPCRGSRP
jgi:hypothetical protein